MVTKIRELLERGIAVHILNMGLIENTPTGRLMVTMLLAFAEFERDTIMDRMNECKAIARANDPTWREGRKSIEVDDDAFRRFHEEQKKGEMTVAACCKALGISRSTWYNLCRAG